MAHVPLGTVAEILDISRTSAIRALETGVLGPVEKRGTRRVVAIERVMKLACRPQIDIEAAPRALVIRAGVPTSADDDWRSYIGWNEEWDSQQKQDAVRGDWKLRLSSVTLPMALVVAVGPFVVATYTATAAEQQGDRIRFTLAPPSPRYEAAFTEKQIRLSQGPVLTRVGN